MMLTSNAGPITTMLGIRVSRFREDGIVDRAFSQINRKFRYFFSYEPLSKINDY